jgi:hypothetical protein
MTPHAIAALLRGLLGSEQGFEAVAGAPWLDRATLTTVDALAGKLPFAFDPAETVAVVRAHASPACTVYLRLAGRVTRDALRAGPAGGATPSVRGFAVVDDDGRVVASAP